MDEKNLKIYEFKNNICDDFHGYEEDNKESYESFLKYITNNLIFVFDAPKFIEIINNELNFLKMDIIPKERFRCLMRIFHEVISKTDDCNNEKYDNIKHCLKYFGVNPSGNMFPEITTNSLSSGSLLVHLYRKIEENPTLYQDIYKTNQEKS